MSFIVSNSGFLIHHWLVSSDLRRSYTLRQLIPLAQNYLANASEWFPFCSDSALRRNFTLDKKILHAPRNLSPFGSCSDCTWAWNSKEIPFRGFLFAFAGASELLPLGSSLEFPCGRLGTNLVLRPFGSILGFAIPGDSFLVNPPCFPPLGFTLFFCLRVTLFSPVGDLLFLYFLGELHVL